MPIHIHQQGKLFHLTNQKISYIMQVLEDGSLGNLYFGKKVADRTDFSHLIESAYRPNTAYASQKVYSVSREHTRQEFPVYGTTDFRHPAISVLHENGSRVSAFQVKGHAVHSGKKTLVGLPATYVESPEEATTLEITLEDSLAGVVLVLSYTLYEDRPVVTRSVCVRNDGQKNVQLERLLSMNLDLPDAEYELLQLSGAWGRERHPYFRRLVPGIQSVESARGSSSHYQNPFIALKRPDATEQTGEVL